MKTFARGQLTFTVADRRPGDAEVVLLLHGFPETAASWEGVANQLAGNELRTLAPDQRGYSPQANPSRRRAYRVDELVGDAVALIEASGAKAAHVVGHDWGATVAWMLAAHHPDLVRTVTGISVPHPAAYLRALMTSRQGLLSWYMVALQIPALPERLLSRPGVLEKALLRTGQSPAAAARDSEELRGSLTGPINWYRGLPLTPPRYQQVPVRVPSLLIWGDADRFVSRAAVKHNGDHVESRYRFEVLPGIGHWIPDAAPQQVASLVTEHIRFDGGQSGSAGLTGRV
jgi:pimeloyl-ACP methyl ester carboxylesterase